MKKIFLRGFKLGLIVNLSSVVLALIYIFFVETQLTKSLSKFSLPLKLGTVITSDRVYFKDSIKQRDSWSKISQQFRFFVVENELRIAHIKPIRLFDWCQNQQCYAHRINYNDSRKNQFKVFTIDDWWSNNKHFRVQDVSEDKLKLTHFFKSLPDGSLIIISEPFSIFTERRSLAKFLQFALALRSQHPKLKFQIGLQIHLQWIDAWWVRHQWILPELQKFSKDYSYPWGVSEFSNYDRIWKRRIRGRSPVDRIFYQIEALVPERLRRAIVFHEVYQIHKDSVKYGAVRFVEWGNFQHTAWFVQEIDSRYQSNYLLFDSSGNPTDLWWAAMRGLKDGKIE